MMLIQCRILGPVLHCSLWRFKKISRWNTAEGESIHRRHINTTVGTTLNRQIHSCTVQINTVRKQWLYTYNTDTANRRRQNRDMGVARSTSGTKNEAAAWWSMSARFLLKHSVVPRLPVDEEKINVTCRHTCHWTLLSHILHQSESYLIVHES